MSGFNFSDTHKWEKTTINSPSVRPIDVLGQEIMFSVGKENGAVYFLDSPMSFTFPDRLIRADLVSDQI